MLKGIAKRSLVHVELLRYSTYCSTFPRRSTFGFPMLINPIDTNPEASLLYSLT